LIWEHLQVCERLNVTCFVPLFRLPGELRPRQIACQIRRLRIFLAVAKRGIAMKEERFFAECAVVT